MEVAESEAHPRGLGWIGKKRGREALSKLFVTLIQFRNYERLELENHNFAAIRIKTG